MLEKELEKYSELEDSRTNGTIGTNCTCGDCELFHKAGCVYPGSNFDKVPEDSKFALDCRSFTVKPIEEAF